MSTDCFLALKIQIHLFNYQLFIFVFYGFALCSCSSYAFDLTFIQHFEFYGLTLCHHLTNLDLISVFQREFNCARFLYIHQLFQDLHLLSCNYFFYDQYFN